VRSVTLGYGQVGNLVQDVAALRATRSLGESYLPDEVTVTTVFHQWMGGFPRDEARAYGVISLGSTTAAVAEPDKIITKSPQEAKGVPTPEANAAGLRTTRQSIEMLRDQELSLEGVLEPGALLEGDREDGAIGGLVDPVEVEDVEPRGRDAGDHHVPHVGSVEVGEKVTDCSRRVGAAHGTRPENEVVDGAVGADDRAREGAVVSPVRLGDPQTPGAGFHSPLISFNWSRSSSLDASENS
jgi:hypothetical protein